MNIINLTPHSITIKRFSTSKDEYVIPTSGEVARVSMDTQNVSEICANEDDYLANKADSRFFIQVSLSSYDVANITGLPEPQDNTIYIVSGMVLAAVPDRPDVFAPGIPLRDDDGNIIACTGLSCTPAYKQAIEDGKAQSLAEYYRQKHEAKMRNHEDKSTTARSRKYGRNAID